MKTAVVLAMHGQPPKDFPHRELMEFFLLHVHSENPTGLESPEEKNRHHELGRRLRTWPRTPENDPYYFNSFEIARELERILNHRVFTGFNEFCSPDLDTALQAAVEYGAKRILVITPMMTRGGAHSEKDIPLAIKQFQARSPGISVIYAWPFENGHIARHLASQAMKYLD